MVIMKIFRNKIFRNKKFRNKNSGTKIAGQNFRKKKTQNKKKKNTRASPFVEGSKSQRCILKLIIGSRILKEG
jgi:hypothetical protein